MVSEKSGGVDCESNAEGWAFCRMVVLLEPGSTLKGQTHLAWVFSKTHIIYSCFAFRTQKGAIFEHNDETRIKGRGVERESQ